MGCRRLPSLFSFLLSQIRSLLNYLRNPNGRSHSLPPLWTGIGREVRNRGCDVGKLFRSDKTRANLGPPPQFGADDSFPGVSHLLGPRKKGAYRTQQRNSHFPSLVSGKKDTFPPSPFSESFSLGCSPHALRDTKPREDDSCHLTSFALGSRKEEGKIPPSPLQL